MHVARAGVFLEGGNPGKIHHGTLNPLTQRRHLFDFGKQEWTDCELGYNTPSRQYRRDCGILAPGLEVGVYPPQGGTEMSTPLRVLICPGVHTRDSFSGNSPGIQRGARRAGKTRESGARWLAEVSAS